MDQIIKQAERTSELVIEAYCSGLMLMSTIVFVQLAAMMRPPATVTRLRVVQ